MNKKILLGLIFILALSLVAVGCGNKAEEAKPAEGQKAEVAETTWDKIQKSGKIVAGLDDNYPPMGFRDAKGNLIGFDVDMANEIGKRLGVEFEWQPTAWDGVVASLQAKKFDVIISGMTITPEREEAVNFAGPYIYAAQGVCVQEGNETIITSEDLKDKIVGVQNGSTGLVVAEDLKDKVGIKEIKGYADFALAFQDLKVGRVDAVIADNYVISGYIANMPGEFKFTAELFSEESNGIALRKEDTVLKEKLDQTIEEMILDGTMKEISEKWLNGDASEKLKEELQSK